MTPSTQTSLEKTNARFGFGQILRNRNFLFLWTGQIFSQLADKIYLVWMIALIAVYFKETNQDAQSVSLGSGIMIASSIPAILFGSAAGVFVDCWPKKTVLVISNLLRGMFVCCIPFLPREYLVLLALTFATSTLTQFFAPAETSTIPLIVDKRGLLSANSLFTATMMGAQVLGFALGDPLLGLVGGAANGYWIVGGAYLVAALLCALVVTKEDTKSLKRRDISLVKDIREGFNYLRTNGRVGQALMQLVVLYSIIAALTILAIGLAKAIGLREQQFGYLMASASVGLALGAGFIGQYGERFSRSTLAFGGSLVMGGVLISLAWVNNLWLALILTALLGIGGAAIGVPMQTVIQEETPEQMRGKVFGLQNNLVNIAVSLPLVLVGGATASFGLRPVILCLGAVVILSGFLLRPSTPRLR
jgi:MFS family permease